MSEPLNRARRPRRRRASRFPRLPSLHWPALPARPLRGRVWTHGSGIGPAEPPRRGRRTLAVALAGLELLALLWLVAGPAFQVHEVRVSGARQLRMVEVERLAGLDHPGSVFAVDAATIRHRLTADPWVRDATVSIELPGTVVVSVDEWHPVAVYVPGSSRRAFFLSDQAVVLGAAPGADAALEIDAPAAAEPRTGQRPIDDRLLRAMVNIQRGLPALIGQDVRSFEVDGCGNLTMTTRRGWKAYFGRVITPEEFVSLNDKLAALKSVSTQENLNSPDLEYVNVMNAALPATGHRSKAAPAPSPSGAAGQRPVATPPTVSCR